LEFFTLKIFCQMEPSSKETDCSHCAKFKGT
jgi:hypothetical protein